MTTNWPNSSGRIFGKICASSTSSPTHCRQGYRSRFLSSGSKSDQSYIDSWLESIVKPKSFYAKHAEGGIRRYFYNVDLHGRLFLEETLPKNIATSIKDEKFLNFFFSRTRHLRDSDKEFLRKEGIDKDYPFVSLCGKEINYIRPAASPIVFHTMIDGSLYYGGNIRQEFRPGDLAISMSTGRLYHRLEWRHPKPPIEFALVQSSVAVSLSENFKYEGDANMRLCFVEDDRIYAIPNLSPCFETGEWGLRGVS